MTKKELKAFMKKRNIWDEVKEKEEDKITARIKKLEKELYLGTSTKGSKMKLSKGRELAIEMRKARIELRNLIAERIGLEANTAEALSDNARFDFMVAKCTFDADGKRVYNSLDDYHNHAEDEIAFAAASALAERMYSLDQGFEEKLPENQFLIKANLVNDDLALVNKDGNRVDTEGRLINDLGQYVDGDGNRVDIDGHPLDADGNYIPQLTYTHENGKAVKLAVEPKEETVPEETQETEEAEDKTES